MSKQQAISLIRDFLNKMTVDVPHEYVIAGDLSKLVDQVTEVLVPQALTLPRHRPGDESETAYRVGEGDQSGASGADPTYAFVGVLRNGQVLLRLQNSYSATEAVTSLRKSGHLAGQSGGDSNEQVTTLTGSPANLRRFALGVLAACEHAEDEIRGAL